MSNTIKGLFALTVLASATVQASYTVYIPTEVKLRGYLPDDTIKFTNQQLTENWVSITPLESEWTNEGEPTNCKSWIPEENTVVLGKTFTQTATDCEQNQTRTIQDREQETTTLAIRNKGNLVTLTNTITTSSTRTVTGTSLNPQCISDIDGINFSAGQNYSEHPSISKGNYAYYSNGMFTVKSLYWGLNVATFQSTLVNSGYRYRAGNRLATYSFYDSVKGITIEGVYELCRDPI